MKLSRLFSISLWAVLLTTNLSAQKIDIQRVEPLHWWVGMNNPELQVVVYGKDIAQSKVSLSYAGVVLREVVTTENPNYLFLYLYISPEAVAGVLPIQFKNGKTERTYTYELKSRVRVGTAFRGFDNSDVIYMIFPDRFANGNESNDIVAGMSDVLDRKNGYKRHGGDLKGIADHLDYVKDMGFTALWINPVLENNQPKESYHGYAITDFYKVDARFGTNEEYRALAEQSHRSGLKVIMDMVFNHCGSEHWFIKDMPMRDWVHQFPEFTRSNYRLATAIDPYASERDKELMTKGWFDVHMPDLNQKNKHLGTYLIQNSIWWVEYLQLDGIRMDTHPYPHKDFMADWLKMLFAEYPNLNVVGEVWEDKVAVGAYFQQNAYNYDGYKSRLPSITDFPLKDALNVAFNEKDDWGNGLSKIYYALTQDGLYTNAAGNVTFLDNHDISRFATSVGKDARKMKLGITALLTTRGIPQVFYGTEIMMEGPGNDHGALRGDFPGGWKGDAINVFTRQGLSAAQTDVLEHLKKLQLWRKNKRVIHTGKLKHFVPENGIYVYFRYHESESVMVVFNNNEETKTVETKRFAEGLKGFRSAYEVVSGQNIANLNTLQIPAKTAWVLELK